MSTRLTDPYHTLRRQILRGCFQLAFGGLNPGREHPISHGWYESQIVTCHDSRPSARCADIVINIAPSSPRHTGPQDCSHNKGTIGQIAITVAAQSRQQTGISNMIMTVSLKLHYIRVATLHTCADQIHEFKYFLASLIFHFLGHCHLLALPPRLLLCL